MCLSSGDLFTLSVKLSIFISIFVLSILWYFPFPSGLISSTYVQFAQEELSIYFLQLHYNWNASILDKFTQQLCLFAFPFACNVTLSLKIIRSMKCIHYFIWLQNSYYCCFIQLHSESPPYVFQTIICHKLRERKVKTLTRNWRDHQRTGTHKHTETVSRYFDRQGHLSQSEESKCL